MRVRVAVVRRQLPAVMVEDAVMRELERIERARLDRLARRRRSRRPDPDGPPRKSSPS